WADRHSVQAEAKRVIFEHRSAAYFRYVSTGAQKIALCRPAWAEWRSALKPPGLLGQHHRNTPHDRIGQPGGLRHQLMPARIIAQRRAGQRADQIAKQRLVERLVVAHCSKVPESSSPARVKRMKASSAS